MKVVGGNQAALTYTSVGIAFVLFAIIMLYHVYLHFCTPALLKKVLKVTKQYYLLNEIVLILGYNKEFGDNEVQNGEQDTEIVQAPTTSTVKLREPLLGQ